MSSMDFFRSKVLKILFIGNWPKIMVCWSSIVINNSNKTTDPKERDPFIGDSVNPREWIVLFSNQKI
jgi:hypothetical protein